MTHNLIARQSGQSMTEYLVLLIIITSIFAVSVGGSPSVIEFFLSAVSTGFQRFSSFLSLPI